MGLFNDHNTNCSTNGGCAVPGHLQPALSRHYLTFSLWQSSEELKEELLRLEGEVRDWGYTPC